MASHVADLCAEHGITIVERASYGGWASKKSRTICIKPVKTQRTYIVALHEIGHIVGSGRSGTRLEQEAAAWRFVLDRSAVALAPATYARMQRYLESYLWKAERSRRLSVPDAGSQFWSTYARIREGASS